MSVLLYTRSLMFSSCFGECLTPSFLPPHTLKSGSVSFFGFFLQASFWFLGSQLQQLLVLSHCAGWFQPYDKIISLPERRFYLNIWIALICIAFQSEFSQWCVKGNRYGQCSIIGWVCHFGLVSQFSVVKLSKERGAVQFNGFSPFLSLLRQETEHFFCSAWGSWCRED